jgi:hypothetical protein
MPHKKAFIVSLLHPSQPFPVYCIIIYSDNWSVWKEKQQYSINMCVWVAENTNFHTLWLEDKKREFKVMQQNSNKKSLFGTLYVKKVKLRVRWEEMWKTFSFLMCECGKSTCDLIVIYFMCTYNARKGKLFSSPLLCGFEYATKFIKLHKEP